MSNKSQWYKVAISGDEPKRNAEASALMNMFDTLNRSAGAPAAYVWIDKNVIDEHVFYFPPDAVNIAEGLLQKFNGAVCPAPNVVDLKKRHL